MTGSVALLTTTLAWGTLLLQVAVVLGLVALVVERKRPGGLPLLNVVRACGMKLAFALALAGSTLTLVYSEIFGFLPCGLCWLQRVFLYPQVFLLGLALWKRDRGIADYILTLSIPGFIIAAYQHFIQVGGVNFLPCPATPGAADCAQRLIFEFGYITFPLMAATVFAALMLLAVLIRTRPTGR